MITYLPATVGVNLLLANFESLSHCSVAKANTVSAPLEALWSLDNFAENDGVLFPPTVAKAKVPLPLVVIA